MTPALAPILPHLAPALPLVAAALAGTLLGFERGRRKPVGMRTLALVSLGACCFTQLGLTQGGDPTRMAAQVVSGIGFLGAGVMVRSGATVQNLTTAATIWVAAAAGVAAGMEAYGLAAGTTLGTLGLLGLLPKQGGRR